MIFDPTTPFLVTIGVTGDISFYTTAKDIRSGVGTNTRCNQAVAEALRQLERTRDGTGAAEQSAKGLLGHWHGMSVQLDIVTVK